MNKEILVIGDITVDETIFLKTIGLSIETPTIKTEYLNKKITMGASMNIAENIALLKRQCIFLSVVGNDEYQNTIKHYSNKNLQLNLVSIKDRKNNVKTRYWIEQGDSRYKYLQVNRYPKKKLTKLEEEEIYLNFCNIIDNNGIKFVAIVDYMTGVLSQLLIEKIIKKCYLKNIKTIGSIQLSNNQENIEKCQSFKNVDIFVCNESEMKKIAGGISKEKIRSYFKNNVCVTQGSKGCFYLKKNTIIRSGAFSFEPVDTCGAGDAFLASMIVNIKDPIHKMLFKSNLWAGLSTIKIGTEKADYNVYVRHLNEIK